MSESLAGSSSRRSRKAASSSGTTSTRPASSCTRAPTRSPPASYRRITISDTRRSGRARVVLNDRRRGSSSGPVEQGRGVEVFLRREVPVDRRQRHARALGDIPHLDGVVLTLFEQRDGGGDDPLPALLLRPGERPGNGGIDHGSILPAAMD